MISKKNKALAAGVLAAAMSAVSVMPAMASAATKSSYAKEDTYADMFSSLYADVVTNGQTNGYLSKQTNGSGFGIPYHSVETFIVEAPDYGHETTSEAMSYIVWMAAMHDVLAKKGVVSGSTGDLKKAWNTMEAMIPGWSTASGRSDIKYETFWKQNKIEADTAEECDQPSDYPSAQPGVKAANPLFDTFKSAYSSDKGYYLMNWLADVDDWYGFSKGTKGEGKFTFINTFQRGEQESCFETVPGITVTVSRLSSTVRTRFLHSTPSQTLLTLRIVLFRLFTLQTFMVQAILLYLLSQVRWVTSAVTICLISTTRRSALLQLSEIQLLQVTAHSTTSWLGIQLGAELSQLLTVTTSGLGRSAAHIHISSIRILLLLTLSLMTL